MNSMKGKKIEHWKMNSPSTVGTQYAIGEEWRNNSRKNEETEPKQTNTQLWMRLVTEVKFDAVKNNIA